MKGIMIRREILGHVTLASVSGAAWTPMSACAQPAPALQNNAEPRSVGGPLGAMFERAHAVRSFSEHFIGKREQAWA